MVRDKDYFGNDQFVLDVLDREDLKRCRTEDESADVDGAPLEPLEKKM